MFDEVPLMYFVFFLQVYVFCIFFASVCICIKGTLLMYFVFVLRGTWQAACNPNRSNGKSQNQPGPGKRT